MGSKMSWNSYTLVFLLFVLCSGAAAFDALDPNANITIKWDVISRTPDGYMAVATMNNFQMYRPITSPGWTLGWAAWQKNEVIWSILGAQATDKGNCSKFGSNIPHSCKRNSAIVDLLPNVPYNQQRANCCKGGFLASYGKDPSDDGFVTHDGRRMTQARMTWRVICTYSQFLASLNPTCCVSLFSFHNGSITPCPSCSCGCQNSSNCVMC